MERRVIVAEAMAEQVSEQAATSGQAKQTSVALISWLD